MSKTNLNRDSALKLRIKNRTRLPWARKRLREGVAVATEYLTLALYTALGRRIIRQYSPHMNHVV